MCAFLCIYQRRLKSFHNNIIGGLGNLGVSISQLLAPVVMRTSYGAASVSSIADGWAYNAGWLWFSLCLPSALLAFFWMNNQPTHGEKTEILNLKNFWWMEIVGLIASFLAVLVLIVTRDSACLLYTSPSPRD